MKTLAASVLLIAAGMAASQEPQKKGNPFANYIDMKPALGQPAPVFTLTDLDGKQVALKDYLGKRPIVIEFGSYT